MGIGAGLMLLYCWLCGWWFARVLMFLALIGASVMFLVVMAGTGQHASSLPTVALVLFIAAWPISGIPTYIRGHRAVGL